MTAAGTHRPARSRSGYLALAIVFVTLAGGLLLAGVESVRGWDGSYVTYRGTLDVEEILDYYHPGSGGRGAPEYGRLSAADGEMKVPTGDEALIGTWIVLQLAPWLVGLFCFAQLRSTLLAVVRGERLPTGASLQFSTVGAVAIVAVLALAVLDAGVAGAASSATPMILPVAESSLFHLSFVLLVPGLAALAIGAWLERPGNVGPPEEPGADTAPADGGAPPHLLDTRA